MFYSSGIFPLNHLPVLKGMGLPLVAQMVKNLPAIQETRLWSLHWDPLEKGMATHSSILAWRIPLTEEPGGLQSMGSQKVGDDWVTNTRVLLSCNHHNAPLAFLPQLHAWLSPHLGQWLSQSWVFAGPLLRCGKSTRWAPERLFPFLAIGHQTSFTRLTPPSPRTLLCKLFLH